MMDDKGLQADWLRDGQTELAARSGTSMFSTCEALRPSSPWHGPRLVLRRTEFIFLVTVLWPH